MKAQTRSEILIGSSLVTASLLLAHVLNLPLWVFIAFLLSGVYLAGEASYTAHEFQSAARYERWATAEAKAPKPQTITVAPDRVPSTLRNLVYDWHNGRDTTKRHALSIGVTEAQWAGAVQWAVSHGLGELVPAEGGNKKLRWTATSLNEVLPVMAPLASLA